MKQVSRIEKLSAHIRPSGTEAAVDVAVEETRKAKDFDKVNPRVVESLERQFGTERLARTIKEDELSMFLQFRDKTPLGSDSPGSVAAQLLPGPLQGLAETDVEARKKFFIEFATASAEGHNHLKWAEWQLKYGTDGLNSNVVCPTIMADVNEEMPFVTNMVMLNHHKDCARIARAHVKKAPNFTPILASSVISTTDNDHWRKQRSYLTGAFMPTSSLAHIFDKSVDRAKVCRDRLFKMAEDGGATVDMSDFYLHEAQAQLQLALFGMDEDFMDRTNAKLRNSFAGRQTEEKNYVTNFLLDMLEKMDEHDPHNSVVTEPRVGEVAASYSAGQARTVGPLSKVIASSAKTGNDDVYEPDFNTRFGNALIFAFAEYQARVQAEVDALFDALPAGESLQYRHCRELPFLSRCVMETLRLWPAVPNGTFRELQYDDYVMGADGQEVKLPKGTYVQICTWSRHRNKDLWGADAEEFNPDRDFTDDELWHNDPFMAYNPSSERFSPFTFPPRDCLGKNFAQMEMRTILAHLFRDFTFTLAPPTLGYDRSTYLGINRGTMGPQDIGGNDVRPDGSERSRYGMHCFATPRRT